MGWKTTRDRRKHSRTRKILASMGVCLSYRWSNLYEVQEKRIKGSYSFRSLLVGGGKNQSDRQSVPILSLPRDSKCFESMGIILSFTCRCFRYSLRKLLLTETPRHIGHRDIFASNRSNGKIQQFVSERKNACRSTKDRLKCRLSSRTSPLRARGTSTLSVCHGGVCRWRKVAPSLESKKLFER